MPRPDLLVSVYFISILSLGIGFGAKKHWRRLAWFGRNKVGPSLLGSVKS